MLVQNLKLGCSGMLEGTMESKDVLECQGHIGNGVFVGCTMEG